MIIITLVENTTQSETLGSEHGLSLYIETKGHKILFDTGASSIFADNAEKMNVDLSEVDVAMISHGHYDHGGGMKAFLEKNRKSKVYLHQKAFGPFYANRQGGIKAYIGLDQDLLQGNRLAFTDGNTVLDDELELFSVAEEHHLGPTGNHDLLMKDGDTYIQDNFSHEMNLMINQNGKKLLIAGCAHKGIINILEHFYKRKGCFPDSVIGGFHLHSRASNLDEDPARVAEIGRYLMQTNAKYYTCHCTGTRSYQLLKSMMGEQIDYLSTGSQIIK